VGVAAFGDLLREYRVRAQLSQEALADRAQVSAAAIGALERGIRRAPHPSTVSLIAKALDLSEEDSAALKAARKSRQSHSTKTDIFAHLRTPRTSFVGRDADVARLLKLFGKSRLVTLTGSGGIGKTRVAVETLKRIVSPPWDEAWLIDLAPLIDGALIAAKIASTIQPPLTDGAATISALALTLVKRRMLLILDNCEHIITAATCAADAILGVCPHVTILATSREPLNIAGEVVYRLSSLALPRKALERLEDAHAYSAVDLFVQRAEAADPLATFDADDLAAIVNIARHLDGIPLAIELAAARLPMLGLRTLQARLDEHCIIPGRRRDLPARQQTLIATIRWSYDLLSDDERTLFQKLSIFAGGFTLESATAVCSDETIDQIAMLTLLSSLVDKSLVQAELAQSGTRYRLLESTRQYGREKLTERGEYATAARAHATAFLALAEELERLWDTMPDRAWDAQAEPELDNWRAALAWALIGGGDIAFGQQLAGALRRMWVVFAVAEGRQWVRSAVETLDAGTPDAVIARLDLAEAYLDSTLIQHKASYDAAARALARFKQLDDARGVADSERRAGIALVYLGRISEGEALLHATLSAYERLGLQKRKCQVLVDLALARHYAGDVAGARARYAETLAIARATGSERMAAQIAINLAEAEFRSGDAPSALRLAGEALDAHRARNDMKNVANDLRNMAAYLVAMGRYDEARLHAREALALCRDIQAEVAVAFTLQHLAAIAALRRTEDAPLARDDRVRATQLLGFVNARLSALEALREYTEHQEYDSMLPALCDAFDSGACAQLMTEGSSWSEDHTVAEALLV
jgi:predicted ATPase/DNA-binding XRE family transcriptional regulator